jgi:DNA-binding MarR family transcriptional regulator
MKNLQNESDAIIEFVDALINARQAIKQLAQQKIKDLHDREITYEMLQVLIVLWKKHQVNQQEIANRVQKNKASLTPLIDSLVKKQLVTRETDPGDRRNNIISLTPTGKQYKKKFAPMMTEMYAIIKGSIPDQELQQTTTLLLTASGNTIVRK